MEDYKIIRNETIDGLDKIEHEKIICINCELANITSGENLKIKVKECIFVDCPNSNLIISKIKFFTKIIFINCEIKGLVIKDSYLPNLQFIGCHIESSKFENSILPGMVFSQEPKELPKTALRKIKKYLKKKDPFDYPEIRATEFIFCDLNEMRIDKTQIFNSKIKHCNIDRLKIMRDVDLRNIDLRGSKFFEPDFGNCNFHKVKFTKGFFLFELFFYALLLRPLIRIALFFLSLTPGKKISFRKRKIEAICIRFRNSIKKLLHKLKFGFLGDFFSSTDFQYNIQYKEADYSKDYYFFWYLQDLDFIYNYKINHPFLARLFFITSNYVRSFGVLFFFSFFVVWIFSLIYTTSWIDFGGITPNYHFYLSFKIFTNFGMDPLDAQNWITEAFVIFEIIIGYFALGTLLSIILFPFSRRTSLPVSRKKDSERK